MSLHHAAQHLAAQGRGPDDQLIHMSSKEVAGLQALAKAHGGSLTRNPHTGLTEAGFLDDMLPTLLGAGAMLAFPEMSLLGMGAAGSAGLGVGALQAARTGDLGKGLMAGLGAYGGAGLAGAASEAGMLGGSEIAPTGGAAPAAPNVATQAVTDASDSGLMSRNSNLIGADLEQMPANMPTTNALNTPLAQPAPSFGDLLAQNKGYAAAAAGPAVMDALTPNQTAPTGRDQMIRPYTFAANPQTPTNMIGSKYTPGQDTSERQWFAPQYTAQTPYKAAAGGLMSLAAGGPVEQMSNQNAIGANTQYPMADTHTNAFATPYQTPVSQNMLSGSSDTNVDPYTGEERFAGGGEISHLGGYSDGGRLLKGPGDGMSDNIPAQIGEKQPARLADGEFVVPADVVSHLGNGSTDAGAKQLYKMMDRIRQQRTGKKKQAPEVNPGKAMPA